MDSLPRHLQSGRLLLISLIYITTCDARIYYVFGTANMTHAYVHLGLHQHLVRLVRTMSSKRRCIPS
jgi:hypothetical protein